MFGFNFSQGISGTVLPGGSTSFRGISVSIGGVLAPLLSLSNVDGHEQINLQVPFELTSGTTWVEVNNNGSRGRRDDIPVFDAQPGIFEIPLGPEGSPVGAVIHLSGEVVSPNRPAQPGEVVSLFLTGAGRVQPELPTGVLGQFPPPITVLPVVVGVGNVGARVLFSGYAPGFLGLYQVNFEIPGTVPPGRLLDLTVKVGDAFSQTTATAVFSSTPQITSEGVVNAASLLPGPVAPGELITIFGSGFGPPEVVGGELDASGLVKTEITDTRVIFDGIPVPLLFVQANQVGAVVPFAISGRTTVQLVIEYLGKNSNSVQLPVVDVAPGIFTELLPGFPPGIVACCPIVDVNSKINSASNPAKIGEALIFFGTGAGQTAPPSVDGMITGLSPPFQIPVAPVSLRIDGLPAEVFFAGAAPGLAAGVLQVNAGVPRGVRTGDAIPITLIVGGITSPPGATLAVEPGR